MKRFKPEDLFILLVIGIIVGYIVNWIMDVLY